MYTWASNSVSEPCSVLPLRIITLSILPDLSPFKLPFFSLFFVSGKDHSLMDAKKPIIVTKNNKFAICAPHFVPELRHP